MHTAHDGHRYVGRLECVQRGALMLGHKSATAEHTVYIYISDKIVSDQNLVAPLIPRSFPNF